MIVICQVRLKVGVSFIVGLVGLGVCNVFYFKIFTLHVKEPLLWLCYRGVCKAKQCILLRMSSLRLEGGVSLCYFGDFSLL